MNRFTNIFLSVLVFLVIGGFYISTVTEDQTSTECYAFPEEYIKVFYLDHNVQYWLVKEEVLAYNHRYVMDKLIFDNDLGIPNHTVVNDIYIEEIKDENYPEIKNLLHIDLSSNFELAEDGSNLGETQIMRNIDCIVNTFCLNDGLGVDAVEFYFDGEKLDNIGGVVVDNYKLPTVKLFIHGAEEY